MRTCHQGGNRPCGYISLGSAFVHNRGLQSLACKHKLHLWNCTVLEKVQSSRTGSDQTGSLVATMGWCTCTVRGRIARGHLHSGQLGTRLVNSLPRPNLCRRYTGHAHTVHVQSSFHLLDMEPDPHENQCPRAVHSAQQAMIDQS